MPDATQKRLKLIFSKFNQIYEIRNFLVHRAGILSGNSIFIGNWLTSEKFDLEGELSVFNPKILEDAGYDLQMIAEELMRHYLPETAPNSKPEDFASYTFRYTPSALTPALRKILRSLQELHNRGQSFPA
jgi:hypothetical protein